MQSTFNVCQSDKRWMPGNGEEKQSLVEENDLDAHSTELVLTHISTSNKQIKDSEVIV